jgi:hypothetical protein
MKTLHRRQHLKQLLGLSGATSGPIEKYRLIPEGINGFISGLSRDHKTRREPGSDVTSDKTILRCHTGEFMPTRLKCISMLLVL